MRALYAVSLCLGIGLLGLGAPLWNENARANAAHAEDFHDFFPAGPWQPWSSAVAQAAREASTVLILAVTAAPGCRDVARPLVEDSAANAPLRAALSGYVPTLLRIDGPDDERSAAASLGLDRGPLCVLASTGPNGMTIIDGLPCVTGAVHEPYGLTVALLARSQEAVNEPQDVLVEVRRKRAMGQDAEARAVFEEALAAEASVNGRLHRWARLEEAFRLAPLAGAGSTAGPADSEGPLEAELLLNDEKDILYAGWSALATTFERRARAAAASPTGEHLGVPRARWERRLRDATRRAWIGCPDRAVPAYGSLLVARYLRVPADLDSLDRAFLGAVVRSMGKHIPADGPLIPWLDAARASLESLR